MCLVKNNYTISSLASDQCNQIVNTNTDGLCRLQKAKRVAFHKMKKYKKVSIRQFVRTEATNIMSQSCYCKLLNTKYILLQMKQAKHTLFNKPSKLHLYLTIL
ncbi:hypothetical protein M472_20695 [Sphingobacterium paucimobilis HER1398]|uniref:Uncharacterized protein n=1 Tax=Sphingobacterium paucimobilis HER1398 TaxID=1346330 RepID=U2J8C8_9SPHI|nr:hypothetical protein M472_20695 [Sphingobacterium paucimobilis HER1398]